MAILFSDGFETLPFTGFVKIPPWDATAGTGVITVTGALFNQGIYCVKHEEDITEWNYCNKTFVGGVELYTRYYVQVDTVPTIGAQILRLGVRCRKDVNNFVQARMHHDGSNLYWWIESRESGLYQVTQEAVASNPVADQWYCVELYMKTETADIANDGIARLWVDGVLKAEKLNCNFGTGNINRIDVLAENTNIPARVNFYSDCVVAADARIYCKVAPPVPAYPLIGKPLIAPIIVGRPKIR